MPVPAYLNGLFGVGSDYTPPPAPVQTPQNKLAATLTSQGLLGDVLPWVYSNGNQLRRKLSGLLSDPVNELDQAAGLLRDSSNQHNALMAAAFPDPKNPTQIGSQQALGQVGNNMLSSLLGFAPIGMTTWHGSPYVFNKFDPSKIGTGEGAQMYGAGSYLAEAPAVATEYAKNVKDMGTIKDINAKLSDLANIMNADEVSYGVYRSDAGRQAKAQYDALMAKRSGVSNAPGNLYKVDLPDEHVAKMLDWDKPMSQQSPAVQQAFLAAQHQGDPMLKELLDFSPAGMQMQGMVPTAKGSAAYKTLAEKLGGHAQASQRLREAGIPGIRYLDGASREGGGTSNFVVFPGNEGMLSILDRQQVR